MKTKQELEATSTLIRACGLVGAVYSETRVTLADGTALKLSHTPEAWVLDGNLVVPKNTHPKEILVAILQLHLKILKEKA